MEIWTFTLGLAVVLEAIGLAMTWRLIWPSWKRVGKPVFYLTIAAIATYMLGAWALLFVVGHPLLGWLAHARFCRRHGMSPWHVDDPERYITLQKAEFAKLQARLEKRRDDERRPPSSA